MRFYWTIMMLSFMAHFSYGQVTISGSFEMDTIVIGDEVNFTLSVEVAEGVEIIGVASYFLDSVYSVLQTVKAQTDTSQPLIPVLADYELISNGGWEDRNKDGLFAGDELIWNATAAGSSILIEQTFTFKLWDPGINVVLYPAVLYTLAGVQDQLIKEDQIKVFVAPPGGLPANQDSLSVAPIKNIQEEPVKFSDYLVYFILIGIALLIGVLYWLYSRYVKDKEQRKADLVEPEIIIPPHILALDKLSELRSKELWQKGDIKTYQSELTYIIREYLEGRYKIAALESTTDEIVQRLIKELSDNKDVVSLRRILQVADLVKFAKAEPEEDVHETFMTEAEEFVDRTKEVILIDQEIND